uniref:Uncharacterized protein n=1 Tax=Pyrodinium bahamense TaxID=73915 RepID=A0A7S0FL63_9DINO|mmetsp:Transcript_37946/g.105594  ORF Transcript_37946/g.105594 Transcript_37946/m.105594 type:complete len:250 (+) Transcript_37946:49-798(+)
MADNTRTTASAERLPAMAETLGMGETVGLTSLDPKAGAAAWRFMVALASVCLLTVIQSRTSCRRYADASTLASARALAASQRVARHAPRAAFLGTTASKGCWLRTGKTRNDFICLVVLAGETTRNQADGKAKAKGEFLVRDHDKGPQLSFAALSRVEEAAATGRKDKSMRDRQLRERDTSNDQKRAVFAVRRMFQRINRAVPEDFDILKRELADLLEMEGPALGSQLQPMRDQSEQVLLINAQRIKNMR